VVSIYAEIDAPTCAEPRGPRPRPARLDAQLLASVSRWAKPNHTKLDTKLDTKPAQTSTTERSPVSDRVAASAEGRRRDRIRTQVVLTPTSPRVRVYSLGTSTHGFRKLQLQDGLPTCADVSLW